MPNFTKGFTNIDDNFLLPSKHVIPNIRFLIPDKALDLTAASKSSDFHLPKSNTSTDNFLRTQSRFGLQSKYKRRQSENSDLE